MMLSAYLMISNTDSVLIGIKRIISFTAVNKFLTKTDPNDLKGIANWITSVSPLFLQRKYHLYNQDRTKISFT